MERKRVTSRVPADVYDAVEEIRDEEQLDRSTVIRRLLERGIEAWRRDTALDRYQAGEFSLGRAAEFADVSPWRFLDLLAAHGDDVRYTEADLEADVAAGRCE